MTQSNPIAVTQEARFLLVKRGLYYGPNNQGYTGVKVCAGRYSETDARPDDGITAIHEDAAPMFSPACWEDVKVTHLLNRIAELQARLSSQSGEVERLREALEKCASSLEEEIGARYPWEQRKIYPDQQRRYDRDMAEVRDARAALNQTEEQS